MARRELSEQGWPSIREEMRQGDERIDAMLGRMAESNRRYAAETDEFVARVAAEIEKSRAIRQRFRERIARLPPPAQAA
jgi:hypothetical protein